MKATRPACGTQLVVSDGGGGSKRTGTEIIAPHDALESDAVPRFERDESAPELLLGNRLAMTSRFRA